jgi:predicted permease
MAYFIILNKSVLPILIIIVIAIVYDRIFKPSIEDVAKLSIYLFTPIMVFDSFVRYNISFSVLLKPMIFMIVYTFTIIFLASFTGKLLKLNNDDRVSFILSVSMLNIGNYGLPLIYFTFGKNAEQYSMLYYIVFNISLSTIAVYMSSPSGSKDVIKNIVKIPIFLSVIIALTITTLMIKLPESFMSSVSLMSLGGIPLLTFVMGLQLSNISFKSAYIPIVLIATIIRLVISPIIALCFLYMLNINGLEKDVALVQSSTPSAMVPLMLNIIFKRPTDLLASIILTTTVCSAITIPLVIKFLV